MPEEYRLGTQAHQILDHERRSARYSLGAMDVGVEQDDAAFERRGVRCVGDPGKDDLLIVHLAGRGVDVLDAEEQLARLDQVRRRGGRSEGRLGKLATERQGDDAV